MGESSKSDASGNEGRPIVVKLFGRTDVGQIREHNEDNFLIANLSTGTRGLMEENRNPTVLEGGIVLGVCDGMGGAAAGEVASKMAVDIIYEQLQIGGPAKERDEIARRLVHAIEYAGAQIFQEARSDRSRRGMGTTSTIAVFLDNRVFVGQVGDSRAYLLRDGRLAQLSRDQSLVNQLIEAGQLTEEEAETFEHNNIILQALGTAETVQVDLTYVDLCKGDVLMMCSDGLSGMIRSDEIREVLMRCDDPLEACRELTDRANAAGGHDNITVIVAHFDEGLDPPSPEATFGYQKYALPDVTPEAPDVHDTRGGLSPGDTLGSGMLTEESLRKDGGLKVGHTMVGMVNPMANTPLDVEVPEQLRNLGRNNGSSAWGNSSDAKGHTSPGRGGAGSDKDNAGQRGYSDAPSARSRRLSDEPVALPTTGFPPTLMVVIIGCAMLLAGLLGYLAMK